MSTPQLVELEPGAAVPASMPLVRPKKQGGITNALLGLAAVVAIGGLAFAGGRATAPADTGLGADAAGAQVPAGSFAPGGAGGPIGGMTLSGTVAGVNGSTMTITTTGGQSVSVDLSSAAYHAQAAAASTDLATGDTVQVTVSGRAGGGTTTGDAAASAGAGGGSLTASDVTITSD